MTDTTGSLAEALVKFQKTLPKLGKASTAQIPTKSGGSFSYKFADLPSITEVVMPLLTDCGLSFTCQPRRNDDQTYDLVGVLRHTSGQSAEGALPLFTRGTAQETGSSMTYGRRYLLCSMTGVTPDEDEDGAAVTRAQQRPQNTSQERSPQNQQVSPEDQARQRLDTIRQQTFNRYRAAVDAGATTDQFVAAVVAEFAQPFDDVTAEQLASFGQATP